MPKYYCDYCDTFLTHDSPSVRKTHNNGRKHKEGVRLFYQQWMEEQAQKLVDAGATVEAHDPVAHETTQIVLGDSIGYHDDLYDTLGSADALVICTDWPEFKQPDFGKIRSLMGSPVIFDGRNLYNPQLPRDEGFTYLSVGRTPVNAENANVAH